MTVSQNVCVLGGTGFVGSALVNRLARAGHWVSVPTRDPELHSALRVLPTTRLVRANVHDPRELDQLVTGADVVINLVGILNQHGRNTFRRVHVDLATQLVKALQAGRIRRVLHMSALGADVRGPSEYLRSKGEAEERIRSAAKIDFTILRPSVIFGAGDSLTRRFATLLHLSHGWLPLARAGARFAPVYVGDVVDAFVQAMADRESIGQTYELGGPQIMTLEQIVRTTATVARLPCHILKLPDTLGRLQGAVMGLLPGQPFTLDNFRSLTRDSVCTDEDFKRLGLHPHAMMDVLPTYLAPPPATPVYSARA